MCGIFGFAGRADTADSLPLDAIRDALRHRGPDDAGCFRSRPVNHGAAACAFVHTRLAILDVSSAGHQPMTTADGRYTIVFNGEIYNFPELRAAAEADGYQFRSRTDTEAILAGYARFGSGIVKRLRGIFAFAIWDEREHSLFVARDHLGVKPLYYCAMPDGFAFASEVRALLASRLAAASLSPRALESYLTFGAVSEPHTILRDVRALPPGTTAAYRRGVLSMACYWTPGVGPTNKTLSSSDAAVALQPVLHDAIGRQLISDVPIGVFLSGGIDSSVVAAHASTAAGTPIQTFTLSFDEAAYDEGTFAADVARRFGCRHHDIRVCGDRIGEDVTAAATALDQPSTDGINTYLVSRAARKSGLVVALSGLGGDELFAGYAHAPRFGRYLAMGRRFGWAAPTIGRVAAITPGCSHRARKLHALLDARGGAADTYAVLRQMFTASEQRELVTKEVPADLRPAAATVPEDLEAEAAGDWPDPVNVYCRFELANYLRNTLLRDTDAMSMAHSLEVRVPLLDHVLVEHVLSLPGSLKHVPGAANKPLLRAATPQLPERATNRPKMGFTLPFDRWFRGPVKPWLDEILAGAPGPYAPPLNRKAVGRLWRSFLDRPGETTWSRVWCIAALTSWCEANHVTH